MPAVIKNGTVCHEAGGELEQIQFLLGNASVLATERYTGCRQRLSRAVNDRIALHVRRREVSIADEGFAVARQRRELSGG